MSEDITTTEERAAWAVALIEISRVGRAAQAADCREFADSAVTLGAMHVSRAIEGLTSNKVAEFVRDSQFISDMWRVLEQSAKLAGVPPADIDRRTAPTSKIKA